METYRLNVARLTFREEIRLLPHGLRGYLSRRFGAARQAGGRFPIILLPGPTPLSVSITGAAGELPAKLARTVAQARQLGFKEPLEFHLDHPLSSGPRPMVLMRHASGNACVRFYAPTPNRPDEPVSATFLTPLVDRSAVMTTSDRRATVLLPPGIAVRAHPELHPRHDPLPLRHLWEEHKRSVAAQPVAAPAPLADSEEMIDLYNALERRIFDWRDSGRDLLVPLNKQETALLKVQTEAARREQRRLRRGGLESALTFASLRCAFAPSLANPLNSPDSPNSADSSPDAPLDPASVAASTAYGFARFVHRPLREGGWLDAVLAAVVVFLLVGLARSEPWRDPVLWLALALTSLLHGLGHAIGWRRVRNREAAARAATRPRKRLFRHLPSVSDATRRGTPDLSWPRATAIFLGPLPGLFAGSALLTTGIFTPLPAWTNTWGGVLLGVNLLTLLPLPFLDGGRLLRLLLFGRLPWLAPVIRACLVGAVAVVALSLQSLFLGIVAVLAAATLPYHCRMASVGRQALDCFSRTEQRLARRGTHSFPPISFAAPIVTIVRKVRQHLPHLVTPERISRVAHRLCETVLLRPRGWRAPAIGLALYTFALLLPLLPALCYLFQARQMAELALIGGAYQRPRDPIDAIARGMPVYIGMEEEAVIEEANGTRTPFPESGTPRRESSPETKEGRGPRLDPSESWIEGVFPSWN